MGLSWGQAEDGAYEARAPEGVYRIIARGDEWCLERPHPSPGRIGGFRSPAEAIAWAQDLHHAAREPHVRTPAPTWPTVDELADAVDVRPAALRSWLSAHAGGSMSPRRRIDPATQRRIRTFYASPGGR